MAIIIIIGHNLQNKRTPDMSDSEEAVYEVSVLLRAHCFSPSRPKTKGAIIDESGVSNQIHANYNYIV